jgi:hypothetical protein
MLLKSRGVEDTPATLNSHESTKREDTTKTLPDNPRQVWKDKTFVVGRTMKVAMRECGLHEGNIREWCLWFNDLLCSHGLSDIRSSNLQAMQADIDFSYNFLNDTAILELVNLLGAFRRLQVKTLLLSSNSVTDDGLLLLAEQSNLRHLVVDDNMISREGLMNFVTRNYRNRQDIRDALLAQDVTDESIMEPLTLSVDLNVIRDPMGVLDSLEANGIVVCRADTTGCEAVGEQCRLKGNQCGVHISGLGSQK